MPKARASPNRKRTKKKKRKARNSRQASTFGGTQNMFTKRLKSMLASSLVAGALVLSLLSGAAFGQTTDLSGVGAGPFLIVTYRPGPQTGDVYCDIEIRDRFGRLLAALRREGLRQWQWYPAPPNSEPRPQPRPSRDASSLQTTMKVTRHPNGEETYVVADKDGKTLAIFSVGTKALPNGDAMQEIKNAKGEVVASHAFTPRPSQVTSPGTQPKLGDVQHSLPGQGTRAVVPSPTPPAAHLPASRP